MPGRRCLQIRTRARMRSNKYDPLDAHFEWRLRAALDRITPPASRPRYQSPLARIKPWRVAPILLAGAAIVLMALTVTATTGSPNPAVWTQRAASTIESVGRAVEVAPNSEPAPVRAPTNPRSAPPAAAATHAPSQKAAPKPEPAEPEDSPQPGHAMFPSRDHNPGTSSNRPSPSPQQSPSNNSGDR